MNGFLLVNKEKGYSSNEIVQKIKKKFSLNKVGHLGTLDPDAEGLLIIAMNRATKFSNYFLNSDKSYYGRCWSQPLIYKALRKGGVFISDDVEDNLAFKEFVEDNNYKFFVVEFENKYVGIVPKL